MCLAVPLQIESIDAQTKRAVATVAGHRVEASLDLVPEAKSGDWILVHAGFAITVLDPDEAKETFDVLRELPE